MGKLKVQNKTGGVNDVISFFKKALNFNHSPYTIQEKIQVEEETLGIKSATQRVKDKTEQVQALQGFEKAVTDYATEWGKYGQAVGKRDVAINEQKVGLLNVAGDIRESEAKVYNAEAKYEERKQQALLSARTKNNVFS